MNTPRPFARFFGWVRPDTEKPVSLDAAEMGTAFGLDMSQPDPEELAADASASERRDRDTGLPRA